MTVSWDGSKLRALTEHLEDVGDRVPRVVRGKIKAGGEAIAEAAKRYAPEKSGHMKDSIVSTMTGNATFSEADIGPSEFYGRFQEHGTAKMSPHPFLAPALDEVGDKVAEDIATAVAESVLG